jgi:DNA helicase HerA-like ATPase
MGNQLFPKDQVVGTFRGFSEGGLEFHADIVLPYGSQLHTIPMHGQFLLVQLANEDEAVLGRITAFRSEGKLTVGSGEDFSVRAMREGREIPEDLLEQYVKYRVNIRVLGVLRRQDGNVVFVPSHRRLPHVGSKVAFPSDELLREIGGHNDEGAEVGFFALGEFVYAGDDERLPREDWMQVLPPKVVVHFPVRSLVARRTLVFARAGFGKSNLIKLLFSELYQETPMQEKRGGRRVPVGTVIFDPEGEYFWPDDKGRPGLADVPHLKDKLIVFTDREAPSSFYGSFVAERPKLDIRLLSPAVVVGIALSPERQEQQNVRKLKALSQSNWRMLVDLIYKKGHGADLNEVKKLLQLDDSSEVEAIAARSNVYTIVRMLHDPESRFLETLLEALKAGKLCVVDISRMRGEQGLVLSGLVLQRIFDKNQEEFTKRDPESIPTIAVVEEAQNVLGQGGSSAGSVYVTWFKEGRKYDLGAVMITQQPGSIPVELLSQGDNWFIFHLLSAADLRSLQKANAHFSDDLLGALLNEPLPGQGVLWSGIAGKSYPIPFRALSFETLYQRFDVHYNKQPEEASFVPELLRQVEERYQAAPISRSPEANVDGGDTLNREIKRAFEAFGESRELRRILEGEGAPWFALLQDLKALLPSVLGEQAHKYLPQALNRWVGQGKWDTERRKASTGNDVLWVFRVD